MKNYIVLYHYSPNSNLESIDPQFYGTGVTRGAECKRGKNGLNKSYFYSEDKPEACVRCNSKRYEIYMPEEWKNKIYDLGEDPEDLIEIAKNELRQERGCIYHQELNERIESLIIKNGYKGFRNTSFTSLPHVVCLYELLSTRKPTGQYIARSWDGTMIESVDSLPGFSFFNKCKVEAGQAAINRQELAINRNGI